jgi:hypothetical protein
MRGRDLLAGRPGSEAPRRARTQIMHAARVRDNDLKRGLTEQELTATVGWVGSEMGGMRRQ